MVSRVTQAVRVMSTLHSNLSSIRQEGTLRRTILSREHFPKFLFVINVFSCYAGYSFMDKIHRNDELRLQELVHAEQYSPTRIDANRRFTIIARRSTGNTRATSVL